MFVSDIIMRDELENTKPNKNNIYWFVHLFIHSFIHLAIFSFIQLYSLSLYGHGPITSEEAKL